jgi:hypothetical protein
MQRSVNRPFREPVNTALLPPLVPYQRCTCGSCRENAKWDEIFAKLEIKEQEVRGLHRSALEDL